MKRHTMPMTTAIISIQSQVVHGHVGNSAAVLPMQAPGLNVAAVPTALLSNHPGFETMRERVLKPELFGDLVRGVWVGESAQSFGVKVPIEAGPTSLARLATFSRESTATRPLKADVAKNAFMSET